MKEAPINAVTIVAFAIGIFIGGLVGITLGKQASSPTDSSNQVAARP